MLHSNRKHVPLFPILCTNEAIGDAAQIDGLRFKLNCALDWDCLWHACLALLDRCLLYHSCSLHAGIDKHFAAVSRHHIAIGDCFNCKSADVNTICGPYRVTQCETRLNVCREDSEYFHQASRQCTNRHFSLSAWDHFVQRVFWYHDGPYALFSVRRTKCQGPFSTLELNFLNRLHTDLGAGIQRIRQLLSERGRQAVINQFVTSLPLPVLFLNETGKLIFATHEAYDLCALWNNGSESARTVNSRQCFRVPTDILLACRKFIRHRNSSKLPDESIRVFHFRIQGLAASICRRNPPKSPLSCYIFIVTFFTDVKTECSPRPFRPDALRLLNQLTSCERRVALLVADGERNHDVARMLGKSLRTVEFQLNAIYRKLGIGSRSRLARLLA